MNRDLDSRLKTTFDRIVAKTPEIGDPPTSDTLRLSPETTPSSRLWVAAAAASVAVIGIAGLVAIRAASSDTSDTVVATPPSNVADLPAVTTLHSVVPTPTTVVEGGTAVIQPGEIVCLNAGASEHAVSLCVDELGGVPLDAAVDTDNSFVMPVDPANASHIAAAAKVADALGVDTRAFDPGLLPLGATARGASVYLVIGSNDVPFAS